MGLKMLSLFSGIGGIDLAAQWAGIETVAFCEIESYAVSVLKKRFPGVPVYGDVRKISKETLEEDGISKVDIVCGGFPCQPFSVAGSRKGQEDDRYLWPEMLRVVGELKPRWVLGENVAGLLSITDVSGRRGGTFGTILYELATLGYRVGWSCYGAGDIGAPHQRDRVFILANSSR
ncbi:DNA cytosine methyltransferase [Anaeroarcus burkinensis]|uniref:DNA cytosine methyltransferase n=1 Tax=Anaeroarcus burkinensis TaxID=82376 RepID=UPI0012DDD0D3|nr:DNA (cytosine-5-)-methyltransferase [Anaeroarcus burkinensis]